MKETTIKCDGCGNTRKVIQYKIDMGCEMDPSGNGYNTDWDYKDFCIKCLVEWLSFNPVLCKKIHQI